MTENNAQDKKPFDYKYTPRSRGRRRKKSCRKKKIVLSHLRGGGYRYFSTDPNGKNRGAGYYRKQHGMFFKLDWGGSRILKKLRERNQVLRGGDTNG